MPKERAATPSPCAATLRTQLGRRSRADGSATKSIGGARGPCHHSTLSWSLALGVNPVATDRLA
jgi:hypothetical protein